MPAGDRVHERRRAAALARHYRDAEGLSIWEISRRLGWAEATVKAYLYDPSDANKRPSWEWEEATRALTSTGVTCPLRHDEENSFLDGLISALGPLSSTSGRRGF